MIAHVLASYNFHDIQTAVREAFHFAGDVVIYAFGLCELTKTLFRKMRDTPESR